MPWYQCEPVRPIAVNSNKADRLLGYGNACCGYSTGNDVIDGLMPGYLTKGLFTHRRCSPGARPQLPVLPRLSTAAHKG